MATNLTLRRLLPFAWLGALYLVTTVTATLKMNIDPTLLELRNVAIHAAAYAIQFALVARAVFGGGRRPERRDIPILLGTALALGVGQEILQAVLRQRTYPVNSLLDLTVDVVGAGLGLWVATRQAREKLAA
jgi:VanZ family protein